MHVTTGKQKVRFSTRLDGQTVPIRAEVTSGTFVEACVRFTVTVTS